MEEGQKMTAIRETATPRLIQSIEESERDIQQDPSLESFRRPGINAIVAELAKRREIAEH